MKKACIFDLYETLIDIRTDEASPLFWKGMAQLYSRCGASWQPKQLQESYLRLVAEEQDRLKKQTGLAYPEIDLTKIFRRLLLDARPTGGPVPSRDLRLRFVSDPQWTFLIANTFRSMSMRRFGLYPGTLKTLRKLKDSGCRILLLSNAQAIFTRPELDMTRLTEMLDAIYISSEKGMKKPQPEFMQLLLSEQHLDPEDCIMVGNDPESDVRVALAAGVTGCLLNTWHLSDEEIARQLGGLKKEFPEGRIEVIKSGKIAELPGLVI